MQRRWLRSEWITRTPPHQPEMQRACASVNDKLLPTKTFSRQYIYCKISILLFYTNFFLNFRMNLICGTRLLNVVSCVPEYVLNIQLMLEWSNYARLSNVIEVDLKKLASMGYLCGVGSCDIRRESREEWDISHKYIWFFYFEQKQMFDGLYYKSKHTAQILRSNLCSYFWGRCKKIVYNNQNMSHSTPPSEWSGT